MPYTRVWTINAPPVGASANTLGIQIRNLRQDLQERINTLLGKPLAADFADPLVEFFDAGNSGTSLQIDWTNGPVQKVTLTGNATLTFVNPTAGRPYVLVLVQDGVGGKTVSLTGWDFGDNAFTPNTGASKKNVVTGLYDGTEYLAGAFLVGG